MHRNRNMTMQANKKNVDRNAVFSGKQPWTQQQGTKQKLYGRKILQK